MYLGISSTETTLVPTILLNISNTRLVVLPYLNHASGVTKFPSDLDSFFPPLLRSNSYFTWYGCAKPSILSLTESLTLTDVSSSLPCASYLMSSAAHLAANSTFQLSFPSP